ncbi:MAG: SH3 domain-containing protein [Anaerolineales bacterium]
MRFPTQAQIIISLVGIALLGVPMAVLAQLPTPILVVPPTVTPTALPPTPEPSATATSEGPASARALNEGTNVRASPDITAERVGQAGPNESYPIVGRYFEWYQVQFPESPSGIGWMHQSVMEILGDELRIIDLSVDDVPTVDPSITNRQGTADAITQTPGGFLTATAQFFITPEGVFTAAPGIGGAGNAGPSTGGNAPAFAGGSLPTYTFVNETPTPIDLTVLTERGAAPDGTGNLPPIAPIVGLVGVGLLGLLISALRR